MKKHWKKLILVLGLLLLSVGGYLLYIFQFKEYETADENVDNVVEEEFNVTLPDDTTITVDEEGNLTEDKEADEEVTEEEADTESDSVSTDNSSADGSATASTETAAGTVAYTNTSSDSATTTSGTANSSYNGKNSNQAPGSKSSSGNSGSTGSSGKGSGKPQTNTGSTPTVATIKQSYVPVLENIEVQADTRVDNLIDVAKNEYHAKLANGENIDYAYFYNKYMAAATKLEERTDKVFYATIATLKKNLKAQGLATSHADSFVTEYEERKAAQKKELLSKAAGLK